MPRFEVSIVVSLLVEAVNEYDARHVAVDCWAIRRAGGFSQVGPWSIEPGAANVSSIAEGPLPPPKRPTETAVLPKPPPARMHSRPQARDLELGIF
ncbi:MAG TPA: hypothetical protein P5142_00260 [Spirochaetia bacterium]|nr:hypothetical protein [Spirochaetia bacterium]